MPEIQQVPSYCELCSSTLTETKKGSHLPLSQGLGCKVQSSFFFLCFVGILLC